MPKVVVEIEWNEPDEQDWLNADNVAIALHAYCKNTKFIVYQQQPPTIFLRRLNLNALEDLYACCLNAKGAYEALRLLGANSRLLGYEDCLKRLKAAIEKAETLPDSAQHQGLQ